MRQIGNKLHHWTDNKKQTSALIGVYYELHLHKQAEVKARTHARTLHTQTSRGKSTHARTHAGAQIVFPLEKVSFHKLHFTLCVYDKDHECNAGKE